MEWLRTAVGSHDIGAHTLWASVWTVVFVVLAVTVAGDSARSLLALPLLVGLYHLLFRLGRWADRRDASNPLSRRATALAWVFPVAFPVFIVVDAVTG